MTKVTIYDGRVFGIRNNGQLDMRYSYSKKAKAEKDRKDQKEKELALFNAKVLMTAGKSRVQFSGIKPVNFWTPIKNTNEVFKFVGICSIVIILAFINITL